MKITNTAIAALLYIVLFVLLLPWFRYVIDTDGIAYINMAARYAGNGFTESVNGYWSPLSSWLLLPFIKAGFEPVLTAKIINGPLGLLTLISSTSLLNKFSIDSFLKKILPYTFAVLLLSFCFYELFADLLTAFLLSLYFNVIFKKDFISNNRQLVIAAVLGVFCYFSKAYFLPFFLLHIAIVLFFLCKNRYGKQFIKPFILKLAIAAVVFFAIVSPYIYTLSKKYGTVLISTAGKLNSTWFLAPGFNNDGAIAIVPPYKEAVSSWDEPVFKKEKTVSAFDSKALFVKQIKLVGYNAVEFLKILLNISLFSFLILAGFLFYLFKRKKEATIQERLLFITMLLLPAGYLLIIIEWRYVWMLSILLLIGGSILLTKFASNKLLVIGGLVMAASFTFHPITEMLKLKNSNKDVYGMAKIFKTSNIKGNFYISNTSLKDLSKASVLCYLTGSKLLGVYKPNYTPEEWQSSVIEYNVNYCICFYDTEEEKNKLQQSFIAATAKQAYTGLYPGVLLYRLK